MKKLMILALVGLMILPGCSGVIMNAEYSALLTSTASLSAETAVRAQTGQLSPDEMKSALVEQANTWAKFVAARDGVECKPLLPAPAAPMPPLPMSGKPVSLMILLPVKEMEYD
jgi:hypothetical protein